MKYILFIVNITLSILCFPQDNVSIYTADLNDSNLLYIELHMDKNSHLFFMDILVTSPFHDLYGIDLCHGSYTYSNSIYSLTDINHGFNIILSVDNNQLIVKQGFAFLIGKVLSYYGSEDYDMSKYEDSFRKKNIEPIIEHYMSYDSDIKLVSGKYDTESTCYMYDLNTPMYQYILNIKNNYSYTLELNTLMLSAGQWQQKGKVLELKDTKLHCSFYMIVGDKKLRSCNLPTDKFLFDSIGCIVLKEKE